MNFVQLDSSGNASNSCSSSVPDIVKLKSSTSAVNNVNFKYLSDLNWDKARNKQLFSQVEGVLLNYYGYQELDDVYNLDKNPNPKFSSTYDSFQTNVLPIYFQLEVDFGKRNIIIDSGDIPVSTIAYSMVSQGL